MQFSYDHVVESELDDYIMSSEQQIGPSGDIYADSERQKCLTDAELFKLIRVAKERGRHGHRDAVMILMCFLHALRVSTLCTLRKEDIDLENNVLHIKHLGRKRNFKQHPLLATERESLQTLKENYPSSPYLFVSERGKHVTPNGFRRTLSRISEVSGFGYAVHPQMLRHTRAVQLFMAGMRVDELQHLLGLKNIEYVQTHYTMAEGNEPPRELQDTFAKTFEGTSLSPKLSALLSSDAESLKQSSG